MDKNWVVEMIKRNKHEKARALIYLRDFLVISQEKALEIYEQEIAGEI